MNSNPATLRIKNVLALSSGEFISSLISFAAIAYLAGTLGPEKFGILGFATAIVSFFSLFVDTGFADVGSRDVARQPKDALTLASSLTVVRLIVASLCFLLVASLTWLFEMDTEHSLVLIITGLLLFAATLDTAWVFKGLENAMPIGISLILRRLIFAFLVFMFIAGPEDLLVAPFVQFTGELLGVLWLGHRLFSMGTCHLNLVHAWRIYRSCISLIFVKLLRISIINLDVILIGVLTTDRAVGLYSAPYRFCYFLMTISAAIQFVYLPDIGRSSPGPERRAAARRHLEICAAFGIPMAAGGVIVAEPLIQLLFGNEYIEGTRAFQILLCSVGIMFLTSPLHNILLAQNRLRLEAWGLVVATMINILLNLAWIPVYGIVGAAWATLIAEVVILAWSAFAVWREMGMTLFRPLLPPIAGTAIMSTVLMLLPGEPTPLYISVPAGMLVYATFLALSGRIPEDILHTYHRFISQINQSS